MQSRFWYRCIRQRVETKKGPQPVLRCNRVDRTIDTRRWGIVQ
jgi:hypothetical protein